MKKMFLFVMAAALLLTLAACTEVPIPETTAPPAVTTPTTQPVSAEPADPLSALRSEMEPPVIAVADFGFPNLSGDFGIMDYLLDEYPQWMADHDFILNMPQERIISTGEYADWRNLVCIVPRDPKASVTVTVTEYLEAAPYLKETAVYAAQTGEPILLLANIAERMDVRVEVVDSQGRGLTWWPYWESCEPIPQEDYIGAHVLYFTPESEKTAYQLALEYGWVVPALEELVNSEWISDYFFAMDLMDDGVPGDNAGQVTAYDVGENGEYTVSYTGSWDYADGMLHLLLIPKNADGFLIDDSFPVLTLDGALWIGRNSSGNSLPYFYGDMQADILVQSKG